MQIPQHCLSFSGRSNFPSSASRWLVSFSEEYVSCCFLLKGRTFLDREYWTICSKEAETLCQGNRPSCIMRRLLRHSYIFTAVGPCVCIIFNIDAYLKGIFEFPLHSRWLRCCDSVLFYSHLALWFGSSRCGFLYYALSPLLSNFICLKMVKQYLITFLFLL